MKHAVASCGILGPVFLEGFGEVTVDNIRFLPVVALAILVVGCTTAKINSGSGGTVRGSIHAYRACTLQTMAKHLASGHQGNVARAVDRGCARDLENFASALKRSGANTTEIARYRNRLRATSIRYSSAAVVAMLYREHQKNGGSGSRNGRRR